MLDKYGRKIDYVRVSITDRCNLRCTYCMPESGVDKLQCRDILSYEDIIRICKVLAEMGVRKVKITGGEPLVRRGVSSLIGSLKAIPGIEQVSLTTNGILLGDMARELAGAGLDGVNISLDTLNPDAYRMITRVGSVEDALRGLESAVSVGIKTVKLNCVPIAGVNENDIAPLAGVAKDRGIHVRFIELMPIGLGQKFGRIDAGKVRQLIEEVYGEMTPYAGEMGNGPADYYSLDGFEGKIGFISAISNCFCKNCNRVRLTSDGVLKTCLHMDEGVSLADALAQGGGESLTEQIEYAILNKPEKHGFLTGDGPRNPARIMSQIGG